MTDNIAHYILFMKGLGLMTIARRT